MVERKKRRRSDPQAPKAYKNAYIHFAEKKREELVTAHPDWTPQHISKEIGALWKSLSPSKKKPWIELAQFDKARFQTELNEYLSTKRHEEDTDPNLSHNHAALAVASLPHIHIPHSRYRDRNAPKRPDSAYICFWKSRRHELLTENPRLESAQVSKKIAQEWKSLSVEEAQFWKEAAEAGKARYQEELKRFEAKTSQKLTWYGSCIMCGCKKIPTATLELSRIRDPYAPKAPTNAFQFFFNHHQSSFELYNLSINALRAEMGRRWREMSDKDKAPYKEMAKQDLLRYHAEMSAYKPPQYLDTAFLRNQQKLQQRKKTCKQDPNAPKLPKSAYLFFLPLKRKEVETNHPDLSYNDVMKQVGQAWKEMTEEQRRPFVKSAEEDKVRFQKEMERYERSHGTARNRQHQSFQSLVPPQQQVPSIGGDLLPLDTTANALTTSTSSSTTSNGKKRKSHSNSKNKHRDPNMPRKPQSAYNLMYLSKRLEVLSSYHMSHNECASIIGRMWREMSDEDKKVYFLMAKEDKLRYEMEMKAYEKKQRVLRDQKRLEDRTFDYFVQVKKEEWLRELTARSVNGFGGLGLARFDELEFSQEMAKLWTSLSDQERLVWQELASLHADKQEQDLVEDEQDKRVMDMDLDLLCGLVEEVEEERLQQQQQQQYSAMHQHQSHQQQQSQQQHHALLQS